MEHGWAVSPHCACGPVYTAALISGGLTGTLLLLPSRDPVEHISSAALNLNGGSELPTRDCIELDDAAAFGPWITSCCMTAPPVAPCRPSGSFHTSELARPVPRPLLLLPPAYNLPDCPSGADFVPSILKAFSVSPTPLASGSNALVCFLQSPRLAFPVVPFVTPHGL